MKTTKHTAGLLSASFLALSIAMSAQAQEAEPAGEAADSDRKLDTIIVTSTKRDTNLQDTPISIGVLSGETIEDYKIADLTDLQNFMPSLTVQKTFGNWSVRVRGLGSGVTNPAFDSSVSIFNDGMYCGRSRCLEAGFLDVGTVEVARGPQGALFGKSTIAGAITVNSARPTSTWESYASLGAELEDGGYRASGAISGPLSETFRIRLAGQYRNLDGDFYNAFLRKDENAVEDYAGRISAEWDLGPDTLLWAKIEAASSDIDGGRGQLASAGNMGLARSTLPAGSVEINDRDSRLAYTGTANGDFDTSDQAAFTTNFETLLGDHKLELMAGAWQFDYRNYLDVDGVPQRVLNTSLNEEYEQKSLEARIISPDEGPINYIAGVMYHNSITQIGQYSFFFPIFYLAAGTPATSPLFSQFAGAGTATPGGTGTWRTFKRTSDTISAYGQVTWNLTDRLSAIADMRYTDENQDGVGQTRQIVSGTDGETLVLRPGAPFQAASPEWVFLQNRKDDSFDPSVRLMYEWTPDVNVYAAYSTGSKPGGLKANDGALGNILLTKNLAFQQRYVRLPNGNAPSALLTAANINSGLTLSQGNLVFDFEEEEAENFEIGLKSFLLDRTLNFNAALFQMDFKNLQTSSYDGTRFIIGNAASAQVQGLELESVWNATDALTLNGSMTLLDATYDKYEGTQCPIGSNGLQEDPACVNGRGNFNGRVLERTPEMELNLGVAYDQSIMSNLNLALAFDAYYSSEFFVQNNYNPLGLQKEFTKYNARIALTPEDGGWELSLVGRNITDERTIQHAYVVASDFIALGEGRKIFLEATKRF